MLLAGLTSLGVAAYRRNSELPAEATRDKRFLAIGYDARHKLQTDAEEVLSHAESEV